MTPAVSFAAMPLRGMDCPGQSFQGRMNTLLSVGSAAAQNACVMPLKPDFSLPAVSGVIPRSGIRRCEAPPGKGKPTDRACSKSDGFLCRTPRKHDVRQKSSSGNLFFCLIKLFPWERVQGPTVPGSGVQGAEEAPCLVFVFHPSQYNCSRSKNLTDFGWIFRSG